MSHFEGAAAEKETTGRRDKSRFPDPRRSYIDPPAPPGGIGMEAGMNASSSEPMEDAGPGGEYRREADAPGGQPHFSGISTEDLRQELLRRQKRLTTLLAQRDKLVRQIADVDSEIESLGGEAAPAREATPRPAAGAAGPRRPRARNEISLPDAIAMAVEVRATVTPAEAAELVKANGYQTTARNFGILVAHTLAKDPRFKRLERGRYERVS